MTETFKQFQLRGNLQGMVHHRMNEEELNKSLSYYFGRDIKVEQGQYDEDWQGDDYYTFNVDDEEIGGVFDIYYINMPNKDGYFYLTEVNIYFE